MRPLALSLLALVPIDEFVVPGDFTDIQGALDVAVSGDTIRVLPGTYTGPLEFRGQDVHLLADAGPDLTILDGAGAGPVVSFTQGEGPGAILEGFTLQGGLRTVIFDCGGGVFVEASSPTIRANVIQNNEASCGGGIGVQSGQPLIIDNELRSNVASFPFRGAAFYATDDADAVLDGNDISGHIMVAAYVEGTTVTFRNNRIHDNPGGGAEAAFSSARFEGNEFRDNGTGGPDGAGVRIRGAGSVHVEDNLFVGNYGRFGGAVQCFAAGQPVLRRNHFIDNRANNDGGGICLVNVSNALIESNLMQGNEAPTGGAVAFLVPFTGTGPVIRGNTFYDNESNSGAALFAEGFDSAAVVTGNVFVEPDGQVPVFCLDSFNPDLPQFRHNVLWAAGGPVWGGDCPDLDGIDGNRTTDPLLMNPAAGDFSPQASSPCVELGDPDWFPLGLDAADRPRLIDGDQDGLLAVDAGAFERNLVFLDSSAELIPGASVTLTVEGPSGGFGVLLRGDLRPRSLLLPFGPIFLERSGSRTVLAAGPLPLSVGETVPMLGSVPVAYQAFLRSQGKGSVSNPLIVQ